MFSRLSLRYRIALVIFALEACMLAGVLGVTLTHSRQTAGEFNTASQTASLDLLSSLSVTALLTGEYSDFQLYVQDVKKQPSIERIVLADRKARVVAGSRVADVGLALGEAVRQTQAGWHLQPVDTAAGPLGTLAVQFSDAALTAAHEKTRNIALLIAVSGMAVIALVGLATGFALTRRLELVTRAVSRFAAGDYAVRSSVPGRDEVALLSSSFNRMADAVGRQQAQLREQTDYVELLLDSTSEAIFGADLNGVCTFVNPACLRMLGYAREDELVGKNIHQLIHHTYPDGRPYPKEQCRVRIATLQGQATHVDDEVHWRADGSSFPVEYWSRPMQRDGQLVGTVVAFIDITERRRAENALHLSEGRLQQATRVTGLGIFDHDQVSDTVYWSPEQRKIYGFAPDEVVTLDAFLKRVHPDDLERIGAAVRHAHDPAGDGRFDVEHRIVRDDGVTRWLLTRSLTQFEGEGGARRPVRTVGAVLDITELKRAEHDLHLKDNAIATSVNAVAIADVGGRIFYANPAFVRMWGYADEGEIIGRTPADFTTDPSEARAIVGKMLEQGFFLGEMTARRKDGTAFFAQVSASVVKDPGGAVTHLMSSFVDITERRALEAERARLAAIVESSGDAIVGRNLENLVITWNNAAERMFGYHHSEIVGRSIDVLIPDDEREKVVHHRSGLAQGGDGVTYDTVRLARDGRRIEVSATQSRILDANGGLIGVSLIFRDISERKRAESALRQSEQRFRALVELSSDWYWQTDVDHRFTFRDGEILRRMGVPPEKDYGKTRWELGMVNMTEADWAAHRAALDRREEFRDLLLARLSPNGRVYWATMSGKPAYDDSGEFVGYVGTGRDVTAQVNAEQALRLLNESLEAKVAERTAELEDANRELEAFSYSVAHDLRAPLRGIDGFSQRLVAQYAQELDPEARRMLERVRAGTQRMGQLITDLLELSRVSRSTVQNAEVDLSALGSEVIGALGAEAAGRTVEWRVEPGMKTHGDPGLLRVALVNLLGNALKYTRDAAPARVEFGTAGRNGSLVEYYIRDNGAGFDMAYAGRLFEPFQRLHAAHEFDGSGVGLATVQRVIAKHGGTIRGEGIPGAGATFHFTLPA